MQRIAQHPKARHPRAEGQATGKLRRAVYQCGNNSNDDEIRDKRAGDAQQRCKNAQRVFAVASFRQLQQPRGDRAISRRGIIKRLNPKKSPNLVKYTDKYTKSLRITGEFKASYDYAKSIIDNYYNKYKPQRLRMRVNHSGKKSDYYLYKGKKYTRPYSTILVGNKEYNSYNINHVMNNNCMHKSIDVLYKGTIKPYSIKFYTALQRIKKYNFYPNNGYEKLLKYNRQYHFGIKVFG